MPEVGLRFVSDINSSGSAYFSFLYLKGNVIYSLKSSEEDDIPQWFLSTGYSLGRFLLFYFPPGSNSDGGLAFPLFSGSFRTWHYLFLGFGYTKKLSNSKRLIIHPEFAPHYRRQSWGGPSFPWEFQINVSLVKDI